MAVDLTLAKSHLRVTHSNEDTIIQQYIDAAIAWVEKFTSKLLTRREVTQEAACFTSFIPLYYGPAPESVTVDYTDSNDDPQTIADAKIVKSRLYPALSWPAIATNSVIEITYTAGYSTVPADLDSAVLLLVGHWYLNREAVSIGNTIPRDAPLAVDALCSPYREIRI